MASRLTFRIKVTRADIDEAVRGTTAHCVAATAIGRQVRGSTRIQVDLQTTRFTLDGERFVYLTPRPLSDYCVRFDAGDEIPPFEFVLRDPQVLPARTVSARRLTVKGGSARADEPTAASRTRAYGQRVLRVNQVKRAS